MATTESLLVRTPGQRFEKGEVPLRPLTDNSVQIAIKYSGICHSDIHQARNEWFPGTFPMVPGHEVAGEVVAVGASVADLKAGDRVGVGTYVDSCRECEYCLTGKENCCLKGNVQTYNGRHYDGEPSFGGYAREIVVDSRYVFKIPDGLDLAAAAPLLCAGVTVYTPLRRANIGRGMRVAVLGFGGLGHLAVRFAAAFGAETYVLGQSTNKVADAKVHGAVDYLTTSEAASQNRNFFDFILNTTSADLDLDALLGMLRVEGELSNVGLPGKAQSYDPFSIIGSIKKISGSNTGSLSETHEMLDFCAQQSIAATIEVVNASDTSAIDAAYDDVVASRARYRRVIHAETI
ncbi:MAG: hypothetical protein RL198_131 [Actinomycetota bacterium]